MRRLVAPSAVHHCSPGRLMRTRAGGRAEDMDLIYAPQSSAHYYPHSLTLTHSLTHTLTIPLYHYTGNLGLGSQYG
jgi:hypothetical protein